jgi:hypothetical protein
MKFNSMKMIVYALVVAVAWVPILQLRAEAMLVPAQLARGVQEVNTAADRQMIEPTLESKAIRGKLHALGLTDAEIQARLSRLSDAQRHQLASQIRAVHPAGDGGGFIIGVLIIAVLVLLIIYLAKRV